MIRELPIERAHSAIRLFLLCEQMNWCHLPNDGGLYNQSPDLLDKFYQIFHAKAVEEERKRIEEKNKHPQPRARNR